MRPETRPGVSDETYRFWRNFQRLLCLSDTGVSSLVVLDCCLWFRVTAKDKDHCGSKLEADSFLFLSLPKMILALFKTGELLRGRLPSF